MQTRVLRTYLALRRDGDDGGDDASVERGAVSPAPTPATASPAATTAELHPAPDIDVGGYRALYQAVGLDYNWRDRLAWSDARLAAYLADPAVGIWRLTVDGSTAGYFELRRHEVELPPTARAFTDVARTATSGAEPAGAASPAVAPESARPCELVYFGLVRNVHGRGLGRWLLERAIAEAWADGADLLWLHTCSLDHPAAIPNYRGRGFQPFATFAYEEEVVDPAAPTPH